tara:strand:- start:777 stop:1415 length:639 start_codon:yes stop_codon:yes gene_type:complete
MALYFLIQSLIGASQYDLLTSVDTQIPFIPQFIWIYHTIIPVIFFTGTLLFKKRNVFLGLIFAIISSGAIMCLFYVLFPSFYPREAIADTSTTSGWLVNLTHAIDGPHNTFPSGHVTFAWLLVFFVSLSEYIRKNPLMKYAYIVWATLVSISTLTLKQHFIVDVFSGMMLAALIYYLVYKLYVVGRPNKLINTDDKFISSRTFSKEVPQDCL